MTTLTIENDHLLIQLSLMEKCLTLSGNLRLPLADIQSVTSNDQYHRPCGWKLKGVRVGKLICGTFKDKGLKNFWVVRGNTHCLTITLNDDNEKGLKTLHLGTNNPEPWLILLAEHRR